jgi:hypothetical protein
MNYEILCMCTLTWLMTLFHYHQHAQHILGLSQARKSIAQVVFTLFSQKLLQAHQIKKLTASYRGLRWGDE